MQALIIACKVGGGRRKQAELMLHTGAYEGSIFTLYELNC